MDTGINPSYDPTKYPSQVQITNPPSVSIKNTIKDKKSVPKVFSSTNQINILIEHTSGYPTGDPNTMTTFFPSADPNSDTSGDPYFGTTNDTYQH